MTTDPQPVCVLAMTTSQLRSDLDAELTIDGYEVRCAESIAEVEARLTPSVADVLIVGSLEDRAAPCALLRGLRDGRLGEGPDPAWDAGAGDRSRWGLTSLLRAFECGADDVVSQPVRYAELRARLAALLTLANRALRPQLQQIGELTLDPGARSVTVAGQAVDLSIKEWDLLAVLASQPTRVFTKQELLREVWRTDWVGTSRTLDSHACRLRSKLADAGARHRIINVWGVGYRLTDRAALASAA